MPNLSFSLGDPHKFKKSKPRHSSTGLSKPRANTFSVQGSINTRLTLGEPFLLLSSISTRTQGTQGLPLMIFPFPNFYSCRNSKNPRFALGTHSCKTQGSPLVRTPTKPKASPWSAHSLQLDDHRQRSKFNKTNYHQIIWQNLQLVGSHTYSS